MAYAINRPKAPTAVIAPMEDGEEHRMRPHHPTFARTRRGIRVVKRPEGEIEVVHRKDVRMRAPQREESPVRFRLALLAAAHRGAVQREAISASLNDRRR